MTQNTANPSAAQGEQIVVCAMYKFVTLDNFEALRQPLLDTMLALDVKGTLLLANEGINGTVAGTRAGIDGLLDYLRKDERLADIGYKESYDDEQPFYRTKVKLKKEIVTMGVEGIDRSGLSHCQQGVGCLRTGQRQPLCPFDGVRTRRLLLVCAGLSV